MDLGAFVMPVATVVALAVGFVLKTVWEGRVNRWLPLVSAAIGLAVAVWASWGISPEVVATGLVSGLAATGLYELFDNFIGTAPDALPAVAIRRDDGDEQVVVDESVAVEEEVL